MAEKVKVISATNPKPWEHGIVYYDMVFERGGQPFPCDWGTKGGQPQPGEEVTGEFSQKDDGSWKFTKGSKDKPQESSTGTAGGQNRGSGDKYMKPQPPDAVARMGESAAHGHALQAVALLPLPPGEVWTKTGLQSEIAEWTDWFTARVDAAGQRAKQGVGGPNPGRDSGSNADSGSSATPPPAPASHSAGEQIQWLTKRLEDAAVFPYPAHELATFAFKLPEERRKKLEGALSDHETQQSAVKALRDEYQKVEGHPVPEQNPDDEIPF